MPDPELSDCPVDCPLQADKIATAVTSSDTKKSLEVI
jgi:hypothetical protein